MEKKNERGIRSKAIFLHQGGELYGSDSIFYQVVKVASKHIEPIVILSEDGPLRQNSLP